MKLLQFYMAEIPHPVFWLLILNKHVSNFYFFIFKMTNISLTSSTILFSFWVLLVLGILFGWLVELVLGCFFFF